MVDEIGDEFLRHPGDAGPGIDVLAGLGERAVDVPRHRGRDDRLRLLGDSRVERAEADLDPGEAGMFLAVEYGLGDPGVPELPGILGLQHVAAVTAPGGRPAGRLRRS